ncbi:MAG TPA: hypothetical protein VGC89_08690 [Pyrinomonadaceae bacterium]|jgi:hypothetical protein
MSYFGKTLFSGSRFIFWTLAPALLLLAAGLPFWITAWTLKNVAVLLVLESSTLLLIPVLHDPHRFNWAARLMTALIFCLCLAYAVSELWLNYQMRLSTGSGAASSIETPLSALTTIGLPCLWYAALGRWRPSNKKRSAIAAKIETLSIDI